jgi:uncharacterized protein YbjT (DUF2867 family)
MNILVLGASGNTGRQFVNMALKRGHRVTAIVRSSASLDARTGLEVIQGDVLDPSVLEQASRGMDAIVSCLGIRKENPSDPWSPLLSPEDFTERCTAGIVSAMKANGIRRAVAISSAGVGDSWDSVDPELREVIQNSSVGKIFLDLRNMEQVLENSALDTLAVRPVALVTGDASGTTHIVEKFEKTSRITTGDVAQWMLDAVERPAAFEQPTEMIGASDLP